jgi:hypothetical protein
MLITLLTHGAAVLGWLHAMQLPCYNGCMAWSRTSKMAALHGVDRLHASGRGWSRGCTSEPCLGAMGLTRSR